MDPYLTLSAHSFCLAPELQHSDQLNGLRQGLNGQYLAG